MNQDPPNAKATRDTRNYYDNVDPLGIVDQSLLQFVARHCGPRILDLGCGPGGYSALLQRQGFDVIAFDVNENYIRTARDLGVAASIFDGQSIPLPDKSVDSVMMIEVLEHIVDPSPLLREVARVSRGGLVASVPNCTRSFAPAPVVYEHMLDVDHKTYFTIESLTALLHQSFTHVEVRQIAPVDTMLAQAILPRSLMFVYETARRLGLTGPRFYFRLLATARSAS